MDAPSTGIDLIGWITWSHVAVFLIGGILGYFLGLLTRKRS
jgi:uncharacterized membrane protein YfcA